MDWQAFWLTVRLAVIVTATLVVIGIPLAYWIAFSRWHWKTVPRVLHQTANRPSSGQLSFSE